MKANDPEETIDPVTFRNEFLGAWVAKLAGMEMNEAAAYMQSFIDKAQTCESREKLARFIGDELSMYNCRVEQPLIREMIDHYEKKTESLDIPGDD